MLLVQSGTTLVLFKVQQVLLVQRVQQAQLVQRVLQVHKVNLETLLFLLIHLQHHQTMEMHGLTAQTEKLMFTTTAIGLKLALLQ